MVSMIYELREGDPKMRKVAEYSQPPKAALVCFVMQKIKQNFNTWEYPDEIPDMRESQTVADHWYYDVFRGRNEDCNAVYVAYPA